MFIVPDMRRESRKANVGRGCLGFVCVQAEGQWNRLQGHLNVGPLHMLMYVYTCIGVWRMCACGSMCMCVCIHAEVRHQYLCLLQLPPSLIFEKGCFI